MDASYSADALIDFLDHAAQRGLMPAATASAFAVASRNVLGILEPEEKADLRRLDLDGVIKRFTNKRARDFNPSSLKEYGRRLKKAVDYFIAWRDDPANFAVKTRSTTPAKKGAKAKTSEPHVPAAPGQTPPTDDGNPDTYQTSIPVRPGQIITVSNIPHDLTASEAERLATFIRMLVTEP
jgi:hypothetical protein